MLAADFTFANLIFAVAGLFLTVAFLWIFITIVADIFRSRDMAGWGKALWLLVLVVMPLLGALIYVAVRGTSMADRYFDLAVEQTNRMASTSPSAESDVVTRLALLNDLREVGALSDEEFTRVKHSLIS